MSVVITLGGYNCKMGWIRSNTDDIPKQYILLNIICICAVLVWRINTELWEIFLQTLYSASAAFSPPGQGCLIVSPSYQVALFQPVLEEQ